MENQRLILFVALSVVIMLLFRAWEDQYGPQSAVNDATAPTVDAITDIPAASTAVVPLAETTTDSTLPTTSAAANNTNNVDQVSAINKATRDINSPRPEKTIHVVTDLLDIELSSKGADIQRAALLKYPYQLKNPEIKVQLYDNKLPNMMVNQTGIIAKKGFSPSVNHYVEFNTETKDYHLPPGQDRIEVVFTYNDASGFTVSKTLIFNRNSYVVEVNYQIINNTGKEWTGSVYRQIQRTKPDTSNQPRFIYTFTGAVVSTPEIKYEKIKLDDMGEWKSEQGFVKGGWAAMSQHYFLATMIPDENEFHRFYTKVIDDSRYIVGLQSSEFSIANGETKNISSRYYIGSKEQSRLGKVAPNLNLAVDFGVLTILAQPIFWLLKKFHEWLGNWGISIILVTLCVKLIFFKLSESAYRSMANMRRFQPRITQLRERYINDKQRMSQAMMELYKKEKINPLGGCLPMIVQIPVFISLYWVLLESVELRQADFILWLTDLSSKDPYYVLPVLMGASMLVQQKLNPAPMDPMQAKIMQILPIVFTLFFAFFPAGLVLYWVVNNCLSISQQWYITRQIERKSEAAATSNTKSG